MGGRRLLLWFIPESGKRQLIWDQAVAFPVAFAYLSYDGGLIASAGHHDRLVKIWRRLSYEVDSTRFDVSYLQHPEAVTNVHWRKPWHAEQSLDSLLYTFCADNNVRVWAYSDPHSLSAMQLIATIEMNTSIQPRRLSIGSMNKKRYAFIVDSRDFSSATERAVQTATSSSTDHALEHLIAVANRTPEICIVLDGLGHMSTWGVENAGYKNKNPATVFNISHVDGMNISIPQQDDPFEDYIQFCVFAGGIMPSSTSLLVHSYAGDIVWHDSPITKLFDTSPRNDRAQLVSSWAGHDASIEGVRRSSHHVLSWTDNGHAILWKHGTGTESVPLLRQSSFDADEEIIDAKILSDGQVTAILLRDRLEAWDLRTPHAKLIASLEFKARGKPATVIEVLYTSYQASRLIILFQGHFAEAFDLQIPTQTRRMSYERTEQVPLISLGQVNIQAGDAKASIGAYGSTLR